MGNRLSKLYTGTGDEGSSGLASGERIGKNHPRMQVMGSVDELNSLIGLMLAQLEQDTQGIKDLYLGIQHDLFNIGGEISMPGYSFINEAKVKHLEGQIDRLNELVTPLKDFIIPGGSQAAATTHVARAVARRAERDLIGLHQQEEVQITTRQYINRLSDLLFVTARVINLGTQHGDILWRKDLA
jgi:cob(I)alamin adenosyltransferase